MSIEASVVCLNFDLRFRPQVTVSVAQWLVRLKPRRLPLFSSTETQLQFENASNPLCEWTSTSLEFPADCRSSLHSLQVSGAYGVVFEASVVFSEFREISSRGYGFCFSKVSSFSQRIRLGYIMLLCGLLFLLFRILCEIYYGARIVAVNRINNIFIAFLILRTSMLLLLEIKIFYFKQIDPTFLL